MIGNAMQMGQGIQQGLLGGATGGGGLLGQGQGQGTQDLMSQYLQSLFMRRYNPPAMGQQPGMVGSQMGMGGMQYMAPQVQQATPVAQTEMERLQAQLSRLQTGADSIDPRAQALFYLASGGPGGGE